MRIDDLLSLDVDLRSLAPEANVPSNPFLVEHVLQEAQLMDLRFDAKTGVAALIFELRSALQLDIGDTGVLVAYGVRGLKWNGPARDTALTAWAVGSSEPRVDDESVTLSLEMWPAPGAQLTLVAADAAFVECQVRGLGPVPDYTRVPPSLAAVDLAGWQSDFDAVTVAFARPAQGLEQP